jgi:hypothetical protein
VKDGAGKKLACICFEDEPGRRAAAKLLARDDAADCGEYRQAAGAIAEGLIVHRGNF